jgi:hypothetical protein
MRIQFHFALLDRVLWIIWKEKKQKKQKKKHQSSGRRGESKKPSEMDLRRPRCVCVFLFVDVVCCVCTNIRLNRRKETRLATIGRLGVITSKIVE